MSKPRRDRESGPRLAEGLLSRFLPGGDVGRSIIGDIREDYCRRRARSPLPAYIWFWSEAVTLSAHYAIHNIRDWTNRPRQHGRINSGRQERMRFLLKDFVYAVRGLRKRLGLVSLAGITLALGIGLTTAMFGIGYGLLFKGLPFDEGHRIVSIVRNSPAAGIFQNTVPYLDYAEWQDQQTSFETIGAFRNQTYNVSGEGGRPAQYIGAEMTPSVLSLLRVTPEMGRPFTAADAVEGAPPVVLIGHDVWRDRFESDPTAVGKTLRIDGTSRTIIGVMPDGFQFPAVQSIWIPLAIDVVGAAPDEGGLSVIGRLATGKNREQAGAEFNGIQNGLSAEYQQTHEGTTVSIRPYVEQFVGPQARPLLITMLAAVSFVLWIACGNVANLLLARALSRNREVAIRTALGASRFRLITQQMLEASVLVAVGGVGGFFLAQLGVELFYSALTTQFRPFWLTASVEPTVVAFSAGLMLIATILSGSLPAIIATGGNLNEVLKDQSRGTSGSKINRISKLLVVGEVALSAALLVAAGLMTQSVRNFSKFDFGFNVSNVFTGSVSITEGDFGNDESRIQFFDDLLGEMRTIPGVTAAGATSDLPITGILQRAYEIEGVEYSNDQERPLSRAATITPGVFDAFDARLIEGRLIEETDVATTEPVVVVNQSFVARDFGDESPIGKRLRLPVPGQEAKWLTIVGVVQDLYTEPKYAPGNISPAAVYIPLAQNPTAFLTLIARTSGDPMAITPQVREAVETLNPNLPLFFVRSFKTGIDQTFVGTIVLGASFVIFGLIALFLAAVGLYGVMSFAANQRVREVGIRMAFGARGRDAMGLIIKDGAKQIIYGLPVGMVLAVLLGMALDRVLFEMSPFQPGIMLLVAGVLGATGIAASFFPARRAARIDPVEAIRAE